MAGAAPTSTSGALTPSELAAVHWFNAGNTLRAARDLPGAGLAYARAAAEFPTFAEAQASLGAVRQLRARSKTPRRRIGTRRAPAPISPVSPKISRS